MVTNTNLILVMGIVSFFNFIVIIQKFRKHRWSDATLDLGTYFLLVAMTSGSFAGMAVGNVASFLISLFLYWKPFKLNELTTQKKNTKSFV